MNASSVLLEEIREKIHEVCECLSPAEVAQEYGYAVNRSGYISCPFHGEDRHPSMKVYPDGFHCFTCQWHGDVVRFVSELTGCKPMEAARELNERFSLGLTIEYGRSRPTWYRRYQAQERAAQRERERAQRDRITNAILQWSERAWGILNEYLHKLPPDSTEADRILDWCHVLSRGSAQEKQEFFMEHECEVRKIEQRTHRSKEADHGTV